MWTIIWTDMDGQDHYARFECKEELYACVSEHDLFDDDDAIVFPPAAEETAMGVPWMNWD